MSYSTYLGVWLFLFIKYHSTQKLGSDSSAGFSTKSYLSNINIVDHLITSNSMQLSLTYVDFICGNTKLSSVTHGYCGMYVGDLSFLLRYAPWQESRCAMSLSPSGRFVLISTLGEYAIWYCMIWYVMTRNDTLWNRPEGQLFNVGGNHVGLRRNAL